MHRVLPAILLLLAACRQPPQPAPPPPRAETAPDPDSALVAALDGIGAQAVADGSLAGLSVHVERNGHVLLQKGYGQADREAGVPAKPETAYAIASITKQFTAAAVLRLAEQGRLSLDDELARYLPELGEKASRIRVRHLLNHTSGLPPYEGFTRRGSPQAVRAHVLGVLRARPLRFAPGESWEYSNAGFYLLGLVVERAAGRPYADYVRAELLEPLGLTGSGYCEGGAAVPGRAQDYESGPKGLARTDYWRRTGFFAAGGFCSTVADLARWQRALDEGRVVSAAGVARMRERTALPDGLTLDYGYGTRLGALEGHGKLGHTGGGRSNRAVLARYPDHRLTVVVLLNTEQTDAPLVAMDLEARLARRTLGLPDSAPKDLPLPPGEQARYVGEYHGSPPMRISAGPEGLRLQRGGARRGAVRLLWQGDDLFVNQAQPTVQLRFLPAGARAERLAIYDNGWFLALRTRR